MAALLRRASTCLIPLSINRPLSSSSNRLFSSAKTHPQETSDQSSAVPEFPASFATADELHNAQAESPESEGFVLLWETNDGNIEIHVHEKIQHDYSDEEEHFHKMHIRHVKSNVADDGQIAIKNMKMSVADDHIREYIQEHEDEFEGLLDNHSKLDLVVKCAEKVKEIKNCIESNNESVDDEFPVFEKLTLHRTTEEERSEIEVFGSEEDGLEMCMSFSYGDKLSRTLDFEVADDEGRIAIKDMGMSANAPLWEPLIAHMDDFEGLLEKRGFNRSNLDFLVKYAETLRIKD